MVLSHSVRNCSGCVLKHLYDASKSSTSRPNGEIFQINYASGPVSGVLVNDTVNVGGIDVTNVAFAAVSNVSGLGLAYSIGIFDGEGASDTTHQ